MKRGTADAPLAPPPAGPDAWARVAGLAFALATLYALAVVAFRMPAWSADHREAFRVALLLHVNLAVFVWLALTMAGQWARSLGPGAGRAERVAALAGTVLLAASPLAGGTPVMADYFPWLAGNPLFATGFGLVCLGTLTLAVRRLVRPATPADAALRLAAWPVLAAAVAAATAAATGGRGADLAWASGHTLLFAHVAMLCHEWTAHAGADPGRALRARRANRALAAAALGLAALPLACPPGSAFFGPAYTLSMALLLGLPPLYVAAGLRRRARPGDAVGRLALALSLPLFGLGLALGAAVAANGAPTTLVTAHYHAAMGAVALSRMAIEYRQAGLAAAAGRLPALRGQLAVYAAALVLLAGGLALAAVEGAPRKTSAAELVVHGAWYRAGMTVSGVGGTLAMAGTVWLLFNLFGRRRPAAPPAGARTAGEPA